MMLQNCKCLSQFNIFCILLIIVILGFSYHTVRDIAILREHPAISNTGSSMIPLVPSVSNSSDALPPACQVDYKGCHVPGFATFDEYGRNNMTVDMTQMKRVDQIRWFYSLANGHYRDCAQLLRMGGQEGIGKFMCGKPSKPVVYSLGSNNQFSFEEDMVRYFQAEVHTFDCTISKGLAIKAPKGVTFHPWCVGSPKRKQHANSTFFNLSTIMKQLNHKRIDILKMDIEGSEYDVFEDMQTMPRHYVPKQILFELHLQNRPLDVVRNFVVLNDYKIFAVEPNYRWPRCCEFSMAL